ncbi:hypothetical protein BDB01DRAFT_836833 [Pilobolus umbonatus]|nr:hypothetical protein BDB01DRAFT_836833 [Pilobolus umbonatus]
MAFPIQSSLCVVCTRCFFCNQLYASDTNISCHCATHCLPEVPLVNPENQHLMASNIDRRTFAIDWIQSNIHPIYQLDQGWHISDGELLSIPLCVPHFEDYSNCQKILTEQSISPNPPFFGSSDESNYSPVQDSHSHISIDKLNVEVPLERPPVLVQSLEEEDSDNIKIQLNNWCSECINETSLVNGRRVTQCSHLNLKLTLSTDYSIVSITAYGSFTMMCTQKLNKESLHTMTFNDLWKSFAMGIFLVESDAQVVFYDEECQRIHFINEPLPISHFTNNKRTKIFYVCIIKRTSR